MAEWFVGPVMEKIIDSCYDYFKDQFRWQVGMPEELQRLRDIHPKIQAVVSAYSQATIEDRALNNWLWQLRDAVDEADDVLDDLEYRKHKEQVSKNMGKRETDLLEFGNFALEFGKRALQIDPDLKRLEAAVQKLDRIATEVSTLHHFLESRRQEQQQQQLEMRETRETGSMPKNNLLGRSEEMEFVKQWLGNPYLMEITNTDDFYRNISLLSIVGHGGMGKTKLLQHIYDDGTAKEFDVKVWVCVSDNFNAKSVITDILEALEKKRPRLEKLDPLQESLKSAVKSKRFLLVLDDIWEDDKDNWENVLAPLSHGSSGSKILITTRMYSVALMFAKIIERSKEPLQLKGLEEDQCLQLFNKHAFAGVNPDAHKRLRFIAREIVKKLLGCPLAAKAIGDILNFKLDESYWTKVLNTDIRNVNPQNSSQNVLLSILKLSYTHLPKYLQNCFVFCCIFPQDHEFNKDDLIRMWIALGFIHSSNIEGETLEETGGSYFDILVRKCFFDEFHTNDRVYFKMHGLLYELAQFVSTQEIFSVMDDKELSIPPTIRHLSIQTYNLEASFKKMGEFKNLRSLFLSFSNDAKYDENFMYLLSEIFKASKNIRLLVVLAPSLEKIPENINCLIHLRYLKLDLINWKYDCDVVPKLPRSVSHLYHLQFLIYAALLRHLDDEFLPRDINNLYKLRYLGEYSMIYEIGKLKSLQKFNHFYVKKEIGYGIGELEHMNELREIVIHKLENIKDAKEACSAKFCDKKNLTDLSLSWGYNRGIIDHDLDEKVLDCIRPHNNLKRLCIDRYAGIRSAMWMKDVYFTSSNLEYIQLESCLKWKTLPLFGQLPFLKSLHLLKMPEVEKLDYDNDCMFPSLEVLCIFEMKALQGWFDTTIAAKNGCLFPCLTELRLRDCPKLQELPSLPTKLQKLEMDSIGWKACNLLQGIRNCSNIEIRNSLDVIHLRGRQESTTNENCQLIIDELIINDPSVLLMDPLRSVSSLRSLTIKKNEEFVSFPIETEQWFLQLCSSVFELRFDELHSLQSLPSSLENLSSLNTLHVSNVPWLKMLPKLPSSLQTLKLYEVASLQCLPSCLSTMSSLKHLTLNDTSHFESLPDLPISLEQLQLEKFDSLQCLPSSLSTISSLKYLKLNNIPHLKSLPNLPSSLEQLELEKLESLQCLPSSLSTIPALTELKLKNILHLKSLPDLPSSLCFLYLEELENLDCLPPCLPTLFLFQIIKVPGILELPELPASLIDLSIGDCHPQLMERYKSHPMFAVVL